METRGSGIGITTCLSLRGVGGANGIDIRLVYGRRNLIRIAMGTLSVEFVVDLFSDKFYKV